jgi:hypothetical protein
MGIVPKTGYGGIYGEEAAGKTPDDAHGKRAGNAANDFADAEKNASASAPKNDAQKTSESSDIAENGGAIHMPQYNKDANGTGVKAGGGGGALAMAAKATPMGRIMSIFRGNGNGGSKAPFIAIGGLTGLIGVLMMLVSSMLPIHLLSNFTDLKNSMQTEMDGRSNRLIRKTMTQRTKAENTFSRRNKLSDRRIASLNKKMEVEGYQWRKGADGKTTLVSVVDADGKIKASAIDAEGKIRFDTGDAVDIDEIAFRKLYNDSPGFRTSYNSGAATLRGKIAGWFDGSTLTMLALNVLSRNVFKDFGTSGGDKDLAAAQGRVAAQAERATKTAEINNVGEKTADGEQTAGTKTKLEAEAQARARIAADINARVQKVSSIINARRGVDLWRSYGGLGSVCCPCRKTSYGGLGGTGSVV